MKTLFKDLYNSFNNKKGQGFSSRKLTAFTFVILVIWLHIKQVTPKNSLDFLMVDCGVILICLGIITAGNLIELTNGHKEPTNNETES